MIFSQNHRYNDVIPQNTSAAAISAPVFCADFGKVEFTLLFGSTSNYTITAIISNQENPPDPSLAVSATNLYSTVAYQDLDTQTIYKTAALYNPSVPGATLAKTFQVETPAARWFFLEVTGYVAGTLLEADVDLFTEN